MRRGDFILTTFALDPAPVTHVGKITFVDVVARTVDCFFADTGQTLTADYSAGWGPWPATLASGAQILFANHTIWAPQDASPTAGDIVVLEFADGTEALGFVETVGDSMTVQLYQQPFPRLTFNLDTIVASEWAAHGPGEVVGSIRRCTRDDSVPPEQVFGVFAAGRWSLATRQDADPRRVGGAIVPFAIVVHTTDQPTETWNTLIRDWTTTRGDGSCAHFAIGRSAAEGVIQLVPIDRNANHAEGPGHGMFVAGAQSWHPNSVSVGIELHCAGAVKQIDGAWRYVERDKISHVEVPHGMAIPAEDVIPDSRRPGRGWQRVTEYQYTQLGALLDGLEAALAPLPAGCVARSIEAPPAYGVFATGRVVGHVSLDAAERGDPWPPTCDWIRGRLAGTN